MLSKSYSLLRSKSAAKTKTDSETDPESLEPSLSFDSPVDTVDTNHLVPDIDPKTAYRNSINSNINYLLSPILESTEEFSASTHATNTNGDTSATKRGLGFGHDRHVSVDSGILASMTPRTTFDRPYEGTSPDKTFSVEQTSSGLIFNRPVHSRNLSTSILPDRLPDSHTKVAPKLESFQGPRQRPDLTPSPELIQSIDGYFQDEAFREDANLLHSPPSTPETLAGGTPKSKDNEQFTLKSRKTSSDLRAGAIESISVESSSVKGSSMQSSPIDSPYIASLSTQGPSMEHVPTQSHSIENPSVETPPVETPGQSPALNEAQKSGSGTSKKSDITDQSMFSKKAASLNSPFTPVIQDQVDEKAVSTPVTASSPLVPQFTPNTWSYHFQQEMERLSSQLTGSGRPSTTTQTKDQAEKSLHDNETIVSSTSLATVQPVTPTQAVQATDAAIKADSAPYSEPIHGNNSGSSNSFDRNSNSHYHDALENQQFLQSSEVNANATTQLPHNDSDDQSSAGSNHNRSRRSSDAATTAAITTSPTHTTLGMSTNKGSGVQGVIPFTNDPLALAAKRHKMNLSISNAPPLRASVYSQLTQYSPVVEEATRVHINKNRQKNENDPSSSPETTISATSVGASSGAGEYPAKPGSTHTATTENAEALSVGGISNLGSSNSSQTTPSVTVRSISINKARSSVRELESVLTEIQTLRRSISDGNHLVPKEEDEFNDEDGNADEEYGGSYDAHSQEHEQNHHQQSHSHIQAVPIAHKAAPVQQHELQSSVKRSLSNSQSKPLPEIPAEASNAANVSGSMPNLTPELTPESTTVASTRPASKGKSSILKSMGGSFKRISWRLKSQSEGTSSSRSSPTPADPPIAEVKPLNTTPRHSRNVSMLSQTSTASTYHSTQDDEMEELKASIESYRVTLNKLNGEESSSGSCSKPDSRTGSTQGLNTQSSNAAATFTKMISPGNPNLDNTANLANLSTWHQNQSVDTEINEYAFGMPPTIPSAMEGREHLASSADSFQTATSHWDSSAVDIDQDTLQETKSTANELKPATTVSFSPGQSGNTVTAASYLHEPTSPRTPRPPVPNTEKRRESDGRVSPHNTEQRQHAHGHTHTQQQPTELHTPRDVGEPSLHRRTSGKHRSRRAHGQKVRSVPTGEQPYDQEYDGKRKSVSGKDRSASMPTLQNLPRDRGSTSTHRFSTSKRAFSQQNIQELLEMADNSLQLDDIDLPPEERHLLNKFVDALSKLSIEINMDDGKRLEGKRRLHNALRAIEGWY